MYLLQFIAIINHLLPPFIFRLVTTPLPSSTEDPLDHFVLTSYLTKRHSFPLNHSDDKATNDIHSLDLWEAMPADEPVAKGLLEGNAPSSKSTKDSQKLSAKASQEVHYVVDSSGVESSPTTRHNVHNKEESVDAEKPLTRLRDLEDLPSNKEAYRGEVDFTVSADEQLPATGVSESTLVESTSEASEGRMREGGDGLLEDDEAGDVNDSLEGSGSDGGAMYGE